MPGRRPGLRGCGEYLAEGGHVSSGQAQFAGRAGSRRDQRGRPPSGAVPLAMIPGNGFWFADGWVELDLRGPRRKGGAALPASVLRQACRMLAGVHYGDLRVS